jgi:hypothetical protein
MLMLTALRCHSPGNQKRYRSRYFRVRSFFQNNPPPTRGVVRLVFIVFLLLTIATSLFSYDSREMALVSEVGIASLRGPHRLTRHSELCHVKLCGDLVGSRPSNPVTFSAL